MSEDAFVREDQHSVLSDKAILAHMRIGDVIIEPFAPENLATSSYDVTLGEFYYRETQPSSDAITIFNFYSESAITKVWGSSHTAVLHEDWVKDGHMPLENIGAKEKIIFLRPGETILAHTNEFIGGRNTITTMMKARSSLGRCFIEVCKCAGWGDIGYQNRWTMEITNNSQNYTIPLVVGRRIAQIIFFKTLGHIGPSYETTGKYQHGGSLQDTMRAWEPSQMLPRCYKDREVRKLKEESK